MSSTPEAVLISLVAGTSPAGASTSATTSAIKGFGRYKAITILADLLGGTGGTLDVIVEHSPDGTDWYEYVHFTQLADGATIKTYSYAPGLNDTIVAVGKNLTTTMILTSGNAAGGHWFDQMRIRYVTGSGNSAGAAQIVRVLAVTEVFA